MGYIEATVLHAARRGRKPEHHRLVEPATEGIGVASFGSSRAIPIVTLIGYDGPWNLVDTRGLGWSYDLDPGSHIVRVHARLTSDFLDMAFDRQLDPGVGHEIDREARLRPPKVVTQPSKGDESLADCERKIQEV